MSCFTDVKVLAENLWCPIRIVSCISKTDIACYPQVPIGHGQNINVYGALYWICMVEGNITYVDGKASRNIGISHSEDCCISVLD